MVWVFDDVWLWIYSSSIMSVCHLRAGTVHVLYSVLVEVCLQTQCKCITVCLCFPDLCMTALITMFPNSKLKSFSYDSMWDSRCVDVFSEREVTQLAPHTALQPPNVVHVSASELKLLRTLVVQQHWAHGLHSLGRAWQASFVSTD